MTTMGTRNRFDAPRPTPGGEREMLQANPDQKTWNAALSCFDDGYGSAAAIREVWIEAPPPGDIVPVATAIGAIYADTYWAGTRFDISKLATDLRAATGVSQPDCDAAARRAFQKWRGLFVRANLSDDTSIPKAGSLTASPDVVINGQVDLSVKEIIKRWDTFVWTPEVGYKNYTYGRAQSQNFLVPIAKPILRMYYSDAGFTPPPSTWVQMFTYDGTSGTSEMKTADGGTKAEPGTRVAASSAFAFEPPGSGHYCLITVVGSEFFANSPLEQTGNWSSAEWIQYNGAAGWHNVDKTVSSHETLKFYNQDSRPERFVFEAHCTRLPVGTRLSLESSDSGLISPASSGFVEITAEYQVVKVETELPPNFAGTLNIRYKTPDNGLLPEGSAIDVRQGWIISKSHDRHLDAANLVGRVEDHILGRPLTVPMGNFTFLGTR
ncbi:hypothetical protein [Frankia sp. CcI49]|uniref:hypothetical protein n=1 Tax=Frankia sp. CcI49 TaxID=1745382 RepID=UPI0010554011|nr:hypothetical protein [Frankia sp. CcI49]